MGQWSKRVLVMWIAIVVVAVSWGVETFGPAWPESAVLPVRIALIAATVVIAAIAYQTWTDDASREPLVISAMVASLLGGATLVSMTITAPDRSLLPHGWYATVGAVALLYATVAMTLASRRA
ncbi:MAG: hypothetical protein QM621_09550 [Aeromicrobium sp.]|uniref:hypothetical protein n=1 Tax=Aeromicrobium sp. TaxID=1871063 RepID=UPI0039E2C58D